jgi:hypothetical protein
MIASYLVFDHPWIFAGIMAAMGFICFLAWCFFNVAGDADAYDAEAAARYQDSLSRAEDEPKGTGA